MKLTFRWYRFPQIGLWLLTAHYDSGNLRSSRGGRLQGDCRGMNFHWTRWVYLSKDQLVQNSTSHDILHILLIFGAIHQPLSQQFCRRRHGVSIFRRRWFAAGEFSKVWDSHLYRGPSAGLRCSCWGEGKIRVSRENTLHTTNPTIPTGDGSDFPDAPHLGKYENHTERRRMLRQCQQRKFIRLCRINEKKKIDNDCIISHSWLCTHPHFQHIAKCPEYLRSSAFVPHATIAVHQDWALGMSRVFLRAGQLKALEDLRSAGAAPDPEKLKIIMRQIIRKKWVRAVHAIGLCRYLPELLVGTKWVRAGWCDRPAS